jgi:proteasome assembly chaperone (PAC2) family protein
MPEESKLYKPVLVGVWPGMGQVAISAGYYLMAKLGMHQLGEFAANELFDVDHVDVKGGLIQRGSLPRNRLFGWDDPEQHQDLIVFIGEAQPPLGKYAFCRKLIETAKQLGVEQVFTFAAMATPMPLEQPSRVFAAAIDEATLAELKHCELNVLEDGNIGGLNGVLLGAAAEAGMRGACLLGEMPHIFAQLPFPRASFAVLEAFQKLSGIKIDLTELSRQASVVEKELAKLIEKVQHMQQSEEPGESEETQFLPEQQEEEGLSAEDRSHIDRLFTQAKVDRSKAYELKHELDRLGAFKEYEDRFLDLFKTGK